MFLDFIDDHNIQNAEQKVFEKILGDVKTLLTSIQILIDTNEITSESLLVSLRKTMNNLAQFVDQSGKRSSTSVLNSEKLTVCHNDVTVTTQPPIEKEIKPNDETTINKQSQSKSHSFTEENGFSEDESLSELDDNAIQEFFVQTTNEKMLDNSPTIVVEMQPCNRVSQTHLNTSQDRDTTVQEIQDQIENDDDNDDNVSLSENDNDSSD